MLTEIDTISKSTKDHSQDPNRTMLTDGIQRTHDLYMVRVPGQSSTSSPLHTGDLVSDTFEKTSIPCTSEANPMPKSQGHFSRVSPKFQEDSDRPTFDEIQKKKKQQFQEI